MSEDVKLLKLDIGCGTRKRGDDWIGIDIESFPGVDVVMDATAYLKTLPDSSVSDAYLSHFLEHLDGPERIAVMNELWRVLVDNGKVEVVSPCWSHERAYGDPSHKWPPITTWTFLYMNKAWRDINAPHCEYTCNFDYSIVGIHDVNDSWIANRNNETKSILMSRNINTTTDIIATLNKIKTN